MWERGLKYFEGIAKLNTPEQTLGQYDESYIKMCQLYCELRKTAGEVLKENILKNVGKKEIKGLLKKIEILSKDTIFEKMKRAPILK